MQPSKTLLSIGLVFCLTLTSGANSTESRAAIASSKSLALEGDWQASKFGTQTLSLRNDGTGDLKMKLGTMAAVLYGRNVTLQLAWKLEGNVLTQHIVGGTPERSVLKLTRKYGTTYSYRVLDFSESKLTVEDIATGSTCMWCALPPAADAR